MEDFGYFQAQSTFIGGPHAHFQGTALLRVSVLRLLVSSDKGVMSPWRWFCLGSPKSTSFLQLTEMTFNLT